MSLPQWDIEKDAWGGGFHFQLRVKAITHISRVKNASRIFQQIGLALTETGGGAIIPEKAVFGPEITAQLLRYFPACSGPSSATITVSSRVGFHPCFADIAGFEEVKQFICEQVLFPLANPVLAHTYRLNASSGLLLFGPKGTGKTVFAQAVANEIDAEMFEITPSIIQGYPGEPEAYLERMFGEALAKPRAVIFLDEAEGLLARRARIGASTVMPRIVATFLRLFSRVQDSSSGLLLIAATNEPWNIDDAFLRPGRLDKAFYISLPDEQTRIELLKIELRNRPATKDLMEPNHLKMIAKRLEGWSGADIVAMIQYAANRAAREAYEKHRDKLQNLQNQGGYS